MLLLDLDFIACSVNYIILITILSVIVTVARSSNSRDGIGGFSSSSSSSSSSTNGGGSSINISSSNSSSSTNGGGSSSSSCCCSCCCCCRSHIIMSVGFNGIFILGSSVTMLSVLC